MPNPAAFMEILPVLGVTRFVFFPGMRCTVRLRTLRAYGAVREATRAVGPKALAIFAAAHETNDQNGAPELFEMGVAARVVDLKHHSECGEWIGEIQVVGRVKRVVTLCTDPFLIGKIEHLADAPDSAERLATLTTAVQQGAAVALGRNLHTEGVGRELRSLLDASDPAKAVLTALGLLPHMPLADQQRLLECPRVSERLELLIDAFYGLRQNRRSARLS